MTRGSFHRVRQRAGYTLVEMLIVLAIISMLAAFAWPAMRRTLSKSRLRHAAKTIRVELAKTRLKAIRTGIPQQLRYQLGSALFEIGPIWTDDGTTTAWASPQESPTPSSTERDSSTDRFSTNGTISKQLPEGALFADPLAMRLPTESHSINAPSSEEPSEDRDVTDPFDEQLAASLDRDVVDTFNWSDPIMFYPNGKTANARILLQGRRNFQVSVTLRGLTGSARVGDLQRMEEQR